ncbi:Endo-1,3(4)-beta-glucanase [Penicillium ucsense]|uniref:Endo-1,3(4)-beta-glucanase n=1 Tax=Penicillium ucsense TaxID=2839758 RepID=A0A8J8WFR7_9EURO|nr:Endo-1,3(4)-beta-glucanase [Penicillium ucsense]KAF7730034.1 Endo-1,3(4)-beta-glucanase [Penicillium ucsense]
MRGILTAIPLPSLLAQISCAAYTLQDDYGTTDSFFDQFNFFTDIDPTHGYVSYIDRSAATIRGLIGATGSSVYIGVDAEHQASGSGRQSVRLTSTRSYGHGLFILDLAHMPGGVCGTWPAFQSVNQMTLHTNDGCSIQNSGFTGSLETSNCYVGAPGQPLNSGCAILSGSSQSYGDGFNQAGGGIYATEWKSTGIKIWSFPRYGIPWDIINGEPDPATWGTPTAAFSGGCDIDYHFKDLQIVFDITFCADWAGNVWSSGSCASQAPTCNLFVQNNPAAFREAFWRVNSLKVYQDNARPPLGAPSPPPGYSSFHRTIGESVSRKDTTPFTRPGPRHVRHGHKGR